jgi:hypothetical protein
MISLSEDSWRTLRHAYGTAENTPPLIMQLLHYPNHVRYEDEPWYSLWSSLCHQQDIYSASLAAVPHIVTLALAQPWRIDFNYLALPACIEIGRQRDGVPADVTPDILRWHDEAISKLPQLVAACSELTWTPVFTRAACGALAVSKGQWKYAEQIIDPDEAS